jgi:exonuclease I
MLPINKANMISLKLDDLRDFLGMSKEGAHDAKVDVIQTGEIFTRFMKFQRGLFEVHGHKFKNSFSKQK